MRTAHPHAQGVSVRDRQLPSANVEHDAQAGLPGYILTGRAVDLLRRVVRAIEEPDATRAWAVTGPYGTGKSSFAMLLSTLLCQTGPTREGALSTLSEADPDLAARITTLTASGPLLRGAITARREPLSRTVSRALQAAARHDPALADQLALLDGDEVAPRVLVDLVVEVTTRRPFLIVLDEFGKNLEYFTDSTTEGDLFLLQELAELAAGTRTLHPLAVMTLQHAPYADYLSAAGAVQRREWRKVQGRFVDVSYSDTAGDVATIVAGTLVQNHPPRGRRALAKYGVESQESWSSLGLAAVLPADPAMLESVYPVHPVALASLPTLCATLGQHDRTLTGFLTNDEPYTLARYLQEGPTAVAPAVLGTLRLDTVYDYFAASVTGLTGRAGSRWLEVTSRIEAARDLSDHDERDIALLKTVGLLNIVSAGGALRASPNVLALAVSDPQELTSAHQGQVVERCQRLIERGFLTYRRHDDEYRVWAGTDIDIDVRVAELREQLSSTEVAGFLTVDYLPTAVVAGRHSQEKGMLRYFQPMVLPSPTAPTPRERATQPDGLLGFHLGDEAPSAADLPDRPTLPVLVGSTDHATSVRAAAEEALALGQLLRATDLDPVARAEVRDRFSSAKATLTATLAAAFDPDRSHAHWTLLMPGKDEPEPLGPFPSMSALASAAADRAYPQSPRIRSEMLGRHQLTSQGAKARREVLTALLEHPDLELAGLTGNGPDMAIYQGVVAQLGLHGRIPGKDRSYAWTAPPDNDPGNAGPAVQRISDVIEAAEHGTTVADLADALAAPPFGVKAGLFPLLLTAVVCSDPDVAIFEEGTFQTVLSPDVVERMVKTPSRFLLKHTPTGEGQPATMIAALGDALSVNHVHVRARTRNPGLVLVAAALLGRVATLSEYARRTRDLSPEAIALRDALLQARDPAKLLLRDLPRAVGGDPVHAESPVDQQGARQIASAVRNALDELLSADDALRRSIVRALGASLTPPEEDPGRVRQGLADLARGIASAPSDPILRGLVQHSRQDALDDEDWFPQAAMIITNQPPSQWRQEQVETFAPTSRHLVRAIERLYALHLEDHHGAQARRLTLTSSDGVEEHLVLHPGADPDVDKLLDGVLAAARRSLGPQAERRLLGALAARTLTSTND